MPLCHSNPDPFLNECYPGCSGYARPPVSIPSTPLLTLPLAYFSADSRRIETKIRDIFPFSPLFSFSKKKKKKKGKRSNDVNRISLELLFVPFVVSDSFFFSDVSIKFHYSFGNEEMKKRNLSIFPLPPFFFFSP